MITLKVGHTCLLNSLFQIYWCSDKCTIIKNFDFVFIDNMILFLLPSIAHFANFRDIAQPGFFRGFPGTITRPGIAQPTLV